jgi:hypothetical protein
MMTAVLLALSLSAGFDTELSLRHFEKAMDLARSDSTRAEVLLASGDFAGAAVLFEREWARTRSAGSLGRLWAALTAGDNVRAALLRPGLVVDLTTIDGAPGPAALSDLISAALALGDSALAASLSDQIYSAWPGSTEAIELISGEFWDVQYPVWSDDSAKILVLRCFIAGSGAASETWRSRAWQFLLASTLATADSSTWRNVLGEWLASCPGDPMPYLSGAATAIDRDSAWAEALALADSGIGILGQGWRLSGMLQEETAMMEPAIGAELSFRRAQSLLGLGRPADAIAELSRWIGADPHFGVDDYHTLAGPWWLQGILLQRANSPGAPDAFLRAAELGDVNNRWTPLATAELKTIWGTAWLDSARASRGYAGPRLEDVTSPFLGDSVVPAGRVSWGDYDNDGWPDLLADGRLFRNDGGRGFTEVTSSCGLSGTGISGGIWGDLDRDGDLDIVSSGSQARILINENGVFSDRSCGLGVHPTEGPVEGVGLCDWNADEWLDIYLACYERTGTLGEGCPDRFYLGGPRGFRDVTDSLGMVPFLEVPLCGRGVSPCDYDRDGDTDIFVSDYRLQENLLWENADDGALDTALERGLAGHDKDGWWGHTIGSAWGDFDNDGDWDLFSANLAHPRYIDLSDRSELLVNDGGVFSDERVARGIGYEETHSVPVWGDWNNDGLLDLYITSIYENRRSFLYQQMPDGTFRDVTLLSGSRVFNGWGAAAADFDRDGRLDLAVGSGSGMHLFRNVTDGGHWLLASLELQEGCHYPPTGSVLELRQGDDVFLRMVSGGSGTTCQDGLPLHFGLPTGDGLSWLLYIPGRATPAAQGTLEGADREVSLP